MITDDSCFWQSWKSEPVTRQILWKVLRGYQYFCHIVGGFPELAHRIVYCFRVALRQPLDLCGAYLLSCHSENLKTDGLDCSKAGCRNYGKHTFLMEFLHCSTCKTDGEHTGLFRVFHPYRFAHILVVCLQSKSNKHPGHRIYQLYSRIAQYLLGYTYRAFEPPVFVCQTPDVASVAGTLCLNYST